GYRTRQILASLEHAPPEPGPTLVTLTAGGNDLLSAAGSRRFPDPWLDGFIADYDELLVAIKAKYPVLTLLAGNIYDPTDGTGVVQSGHDQWARLFAFLHTLNTRIFERLELAGAVPVDIHSAFFGKANDEKHPWVFYNIEPTKLGSSEIRRLFWQASGLG
ncbi:MAG: SGNH/GDSL hydrolase family protein, partial [Candidatus Eremiobacteraeota bacterium]|nr:SGNH/GDSL hydrolase family protein [Candidatus Eremiobacteraeota bacterium]